MFVSKIVDAAGEAGETEVWLDVAKDTEYLELQKYKELSSGYDEVNRTGLSHFQATFDNEFIT